MPAAEPGPAEGLRKAVHGEGRQDGSRGPEELVPVVAEEARNDGAIGLSGTGVDLAHSSRALASNRSGSQMR